MTYRLVDRARSAADVREGKDSSVADLLNECADEIERLRRQSAELNATLQDDVRVLLEACGLGTHARNASPREVLLDEVVPHVQRLRGGQR